ncbi:phosphatase 2C-like domain-containing protein [Phlebopus sp. FC_14]|nr:phosphatase 2C-like domain-containing protein [Phlebopus sp. FC_14]
MIYSLISLSAATSTENLQALEEVKNFCTTDLGRGGKQRWTYHLLEESEIDAKLQRLSSPCSSKFIDSVTFQPCSEYADPNEDRYSIEEWDLHGGVWQFTAIYDGKAHFSSRYCAIEMTGLILGHCGHETVNFVYKRLPSMVRMSLQALLGSSPNSIPSPELVSEALSNSIRHLDDSIRSDLFDFLPSDQLARMCDAELCLHIRRHSSDWNAISARCTQGSTVILTLSDPAKKNLWVVNLGDSQAVLAKKRPSGGWSGVIVNSLHNCANPLECQRITREHPGERECISNNRVVGYLSPTRGIGDTWLKVPAIYTRRVFAEYIPDWIGPPLVTEYAGRILTPPYILDVPDVHHYAFDASNDRQEYFLILCSDGLLDLYDNVHAQLSEQELADRWVDIVGRSLKMRRDTGVSRNPALDLLRDAIGGRDLALASRNLTLEMDDKWLDDVTILVQCF